MSEDQTREDSHEVAGEQEASTADAAVVETKTPEFAPVTDTSRPNQEKSLNRFLDVEVTISAELGRVTIPIGELVELGSPSTIKPFSNVRHY